MVIESFPHQKTRKWHPSLEYFMGKNIVSAKKVKLSDALYYLFGNHNLSLPVLCNDYWRNAVDEQRVSVAPE